MEFLRNNIIIGLVIAVFTTIWALILHNGHCTDTNAVLIVGGLTLSFINTMLFELGKSIIEEIKKLKGQ